MHAVRQLHIGELVVVSHLALQARELPMQRGGEKIAARKADVLKAA